MALKRKAERHRSSALQAARRRGVTADRHERNLACNARFSQVLRGSRGTLIEQALPALPFKATVTYAPDKTEDGAAREAPDECFRLRPRRFRLFCRSRPRRPSGVV